MKRLLVLAAIFSFSFASFSDSALAQDNVQERTLSISASLTEEFAPDIAMISIAVETNAKTALEASQENNSKSEKVIAGIKRLIGKEDSVKTTAYNVQPVYEYDKLKGEVLKGYRATNQVVVKTKLLKSLGEIIDKSVGEGANRINDLRFDIEDNTKYCESVISKAAVKARSQADSAAKALGVRITGVRHIAPSCGEQGISVYQPRLAAMKEAVRAPIEAGALALTGSVDVVFDIAD